MSDPAVPVVHIGGPDKKPRLLRDLLQEKVEAVPPGGAIAWATYYFRDRQLAHALVAAHDRGVSVVVQVEGSPRREGANDEVLRILASRDLTGLHIHRSRTPLLHSHLHSKIYHFSHPVPSALVGSFNPSGDDPEDAAVVAEIGDQDRGHNILVELFDSALVDGLGHHVAHLHKPFARWRNRHALAGSDATAWFFPRHDPGLVERSLEGAQTITGCISHLKQGPFERRLKEQARLGARIELLVHDTSRRVPPAVVTSLAEAGVSIRRYSHAEDLPLHAKFLVIDGTAWFGSFNYNPRSRWLNSEVLVASRDPVIVEALRARFSEIASAAT